MIFFLKKALTLLGVLSFFLSGVAFLLFLWVFAGPRPVNWLEPVAQAQLAKLLPQYALHIEDTYLVWSGIEEGFTLEVRDVEILDHLNNPMLSLNALSLNVDILPMLWFDFTPKNISLIRPHLYLLKEEGSVAFGIKNQQKSKPNFKPFFLLAEGLKDKYALDQLTITDATVEVSSKDYQALWNIEYGVFSVNRIAVEPQFIFSFSGAVENRPMEAEIVFHFPYKEVMLTEIRLKDFPLDIVASFLGEGFAIEDVHGTIAGTLEMLVSQSGLFRLKSFALTHVEGGFRFDQWFDQAVDFSHLALKGAWDANKGLFVFEDLVFESRGSRLVAEGEVDLNTSRPKLNAVANYTNLPVATMKRLWPKFFIPKSRQWVFEHVHQGVISKASGHFHIDFIDVDQKLLPDQAVDAAVAFHGANIDFTASLPVAENVKGNMVFTGNSVKATNITGRYLGTAIKEVAFAIPHFGKGDKQFTLTAKATGEVKDLLTVYQAMSNSVFPVDSMKIQGKADSELTIQVPIKQNILPEEVTLSFASTLHDVGFAYPTEQYSFSQGSINVNYEIGLLNLSGKGKMFDRDVNISMHHQIQLARQSSAKTALVVRTSLPFSTLIELGVPDLSLWEREGEVGMVLSVNDLEKLPTLKAQFDISDIALHVPWLGYAKRRGEKALIEVNAQHDKAKKQWLLHKIQAEGDQLSLLGEGKVSDDLSVVDSLYFPHLQVGKSVAKLHLTKSDDHYKLQIESPYLEVSNIALEKMLLNKSKASIFPKSVEVSLALKHVSLNQVNSFQDLSLAMTKSNNDITSLVMVSTMGTQDQLSLKYDTNELLFKASNTGALLNALGLFDHIVGGELDVYASKENGQLVGRAIILDFTTKKAPIMAKVVNLASFGGVGNLLDNKGIPFKKFFLPFALGDEQFVIKNARASGPSMGFTITGDISLKDPKVMALHGTVVPSYTLNHMVGKIPIVGNVLVGGEGQGVIAVKYKVEGEYDDAKVSVNPLSALTPGFLRNLFDVMDQVQ